MLDIIIRQGEIVDGSGSERFVGDIGIRHQKIVEIAPHIQANTNKEIDATGKVVSPGFIDVHTHDDLVLFDDPYNLPKLLQGVTTVIVGNCGFGACPSNDTTIGLLTNYARPILGENIEKNVFSSFGAYAKALDETPKAQNIAAFIAHGPLYINEKGFQSTSFTPEEMKNAKKQVENAMEHGALGMSVGYMYVPGYYATHEDMTPLCQIVADHNGRLVVHMRSESELIEESIEEVLALGNATDVAMHISHFKNTGKQFQGRMKDFTKQMQQHIENGTDITYDMYPYSMGSTTMAILFPTELLDDGVLSFLTYIKDEAQRQQVKESLKVMWPEADNLALLTGWEGIYIASLQSKENTPLIGKTVADIAKERKVSPEEACLQLFSEEEGEVTVLLNHILEKDMLDTITSPPCMVASDGIPGGKSPHPRLYGTFPSFLREFVRERKLLTLEEAIPKMTAFPAKRFGLGKRGLLKKNYTADIVIFDEAVVTDAATYTQPRQYPKGIDYVIVSGTVVANHGEVTGEKTGQWIPYQDGQKAWNL